MVVHLHKIYTYKPTAGKENHLDYRGDPVSCGTRKREYHLTFACRIGRHPVLASLAIEVFSSK